MKKAGEPVLAKVAAIFFPIWPDFPMPVTMMRPVHANKSSHARSKFASMCCVKLKIAAASVSMTVRPDVQKVMMRLVE